MVSEDQQQILDIKVKYEDAIYGIIRYKEKIDQLKQSIKDLQQQEKDKTITTNEMKVQTEAINATIKEYQYNVRALQKEIQNNVRTENEQEGSLKQLRAQLSNATKAYDEMSRAERDSSKGQEMQEHIQDLIEELKEAEEATGRFQRSVGSYYDSMMKAAGDLQNTEFFGFDVVDDTGIGKVMEMGKSVEDLRVKFGALKNTALSLLTNPYFLAMAGVAGVGMAFKWFYDYNKGIEEATRKTMQFTGLFGDEMKSVRNQALAISETFNVDFGETLQSANVMSKQFGISVSESLKLLQDGFVAGANASDEFLENVKEYPTYLKEAGLNAEQFVAISTNATKQGIFSDKGLDTIKEGNIRLREMTTATAAALDGIGISSKKVQKELQNGSKTTFDIMQEVGNKLKEFPASSAKVGTAISDIFGGPGEDAGLKYIETLGDIEMNMDKVKEQSSDVAKAQEKQVEANKRLKDTASALFDVTGGGFEMMKAQAATFVSNHLTKLLRAIINLYNQSVAFRGLIQLIGFAFKSVGQIALVAFNIIIDAIKLVARPARGLLQMFEGFFSFDVKKMRDGFNSIFSGLGNTVKEAWGDLKKFGSGMADAIVGGMKNTFNHANIKIPVSADAPSMATATTDNTKLKDGTNIASTTPKTKKEKAAADKAAKEEAERRKKQEKELQEAIALIQYQYNEQVMDAKKRYLAGMYDNDRDYSNDLEQLEKNMVARSIDAYVAAGQIGAEKAQEMQAKLLDIMIKVKEDIKNQAKEIVDELNKEFEEAEKKRRDADIMNGGTGEEDDAAKLERYKAFLEQKLAMTQENTEAHKQIDQSLADTLIEIQKKKNQALIDEEEAKKEKFKAIYQQIADGLASAMDEMFEAETAKGKAFLKSMLITALNILEPFILTKLKVTQIAEKGLWGIAEAAALTAIVKAAFAGAKSVIKGFSTGGYVQGSGTGTSDSIPARLSNGESVMTAKATSMFSPILSAFNQLGGGVPIVVNNGGSNIGMDMLAAAVARGYQMAPQPVVSVEEINRTQRRVQTIENIGRL